MPEQNWFATNAPAAPAAPDWFAASAPPAPAASPGTRFAEGAWKNLNPAGLVQAVRHPIDTLGALIDAQVEQIQQAKSFYDHGRYSEAAGHLGAGLLPLVGPPAAKAGERIGSGDIAGGLGEATGLIAALEAPKVAGKVAGAVKSGAQSVATVGQALADAPLTARIAPKLVKHGTTVVGGAVGGWPGAIVGREVGADLAEALQARMTPKPAAVDPAAPHLDRSVPVQPGALTQEQIAERVFGGQGTPSPAVEKPPLGRVRGVRDVIAPDVQPVGPVASPLDVPAPPAASGAPSAVPPSPLESVNPAPAPKNTLPDQKALNEAALAQRRVAYQARVQAEADAAAATGQPQPPPARLKLTAPESKEYMRLRRAGLSDPQVMDAIQAARDLQARFGTPTPTVAETKFPKS